jgi:WD40 repeat protein
MRTPNDYYLTITLENRDGREYRDHTYDVNAVSCSVCSKFFATCSKDNTIKVYLFVENKILNTFYEPLPVNAIRFLSIRNLCLATAGDEGIIKIWNIK